MHSPADVFIRNQPMNTSFVSDPMPIWQMDGFAIQANWDVSANGTFQLEYSCDPQTGKDPTTGQVYPFNWAPDADSITIINGDGSWIWNYPAARFFWVRLTWTDTSGGSSLAILTTATYNGKGP